MRISSWLRDNGIVLALLVVKILTVIRTGIDTFAISHDMLNVLLIDGVFTAMWLYAAFAGDSQRASRLRPFAILGAWTMYGFILVIGWDAHADNFLIATAVRTAGALALLYDTWDYVSKYIWAFVAKLWMNTIRMWTKPSVEELYNREFTKALRSSIPSSIKRIRGELDDLVYEHSSTQLPQLVSGQLPDRLDVTPLTTVDNYPPSVVDGWKSIKDSLRPGEQFRRSDVEQHMPCSRQWAVNIINCGRQQGDVGELKRGLYVYKPSSNGNGHKDNIQLIEQ